MFETPEYSILPLLLICGTFCNLGVACGLEAVPGDSLGLDLEVDWVDLLGWEDDEDWDVEAGDVPSAGKVEAEAANCDPGPFHLSWEAKGGKVVKLF